MDKYIPFDKEELYIETNNIEKPYYEEKGELYIDDSLVEEYNLKTNIYNKLNNSSKFVISKRIIDYHLVSNINSRISKICKEKKEFNSSLNSRTGNSKSARKTKEDMLNNLISIIDFNEKILTKDRKRLDLFNDIFNNIVDKDYVSGSYNLDELHNYMNGFNIKLKHNVIDDFMDYAYIKCSSIDSYNKFNKDYSIAFLEENRFINDVNNRRK